MCAVTRQAELRSIHHVFNFKECHHPHPTPPRPNPYRSSPLRTCRLCDVQKWQLSRATRVRDTTNKICHSLAVRSKFSHARPNNATAAQYWDDTQLCYCGWLKFCTTCNDAYQLVEDFSHQQLSRIYCPQFRWFSGIVSSMLTIAFPISGVLRL